MATSVSNSGEYQVPTDNQQRTSMCSDGRSALIAEMTRAYLGGFFDGEGCIHLAKQTFKDPMRRATFRMRLVIAQNNLGILEYFAQEVGVTGKIHRITRTRSQNRQCYALIFDGATAFEVLRNLLPYLRRKLPEALVALEYERSCAIHIHPGRRGIAADDWALRARFYRKLRAMK